MTIKSNRARFDLYVSIHLLANNLRGLLSHLYGKVSMKETIKVLISNEVLEFAED